MFKTKFHYNPKTLRYERVKLSILNVIVSGLSYVAFGAIFFVGLVLIENYFAETPKEGALRKENAALENYKVLLAGQLDRSALELSALRDQESSLYQSLFETSKPERELPKIHREEILISNPTKFNEWVASIENKFRETHNRAVISNNHFSQTTQVEKPDLTSLFQTPSVPPVANFAIEQLISGFGTRINPFHKGLYHHDGLDIAAPTGSPVVAAGNGKVVAAVTTTQIGGFGNYIEIDHGNGLISRYAHLGALSVRTGQRISKGQTIAVIGVSGASVAPHVHYEIIKDGQNINPVKFIIAGLNSAQYELLMVNSANQNQSLD